MKLARSQIHLVDSFVGKGIFTRRDVKNILSPKAFNLKKMLDDLKDDGIIQQCQCGSMTIVGTSDKIYAKVFQLHKKSKYGDAWQCMRQQKYFIVRDMIERAGLPLGKANRYVFLLYKLGFLRRLQGLPPYKYQLIKNTGPYAPRANTSFKQLYDPNKNEWHYV